MNKRTRVGLLPTPIFAGMGLSAQAKNQLFLAFIPILSRRRRICLSPTDLRCSFVDNFRSAPQVVSGVLVEDRIFPSPPL